MVISNSMIYTLHLSLKSYHRNYANISSCFSSKRMRDAVSSGKPHINLSFSEHRAINQWVNYVECFASDVSSGRDLCETFAVRSYNSGN